MLGLIRKEINYILKELQELANAWCHEPGEYPWDWILRYMFKAARTSH